MTVRDTDSVDALRRRLATARRVLLVGNGGIAMELVGALCGGGLREGARGGSTAGGEGCEGKYSGGGGGGVCRDGEEEDVDRGASGSGDGDDSSPSSGPELVWAVRHPTVGDAFFDRDAAGFLLGLLERTTSAAAAARDSLVTSAAAAASVAVAAAVIDKHEQPQPQRRRKRKRLRLRRMRSEGDAEDDAEKNTRGEVHADEPGERRRRRAHEGKGGDGSSGNGGVAGNGGAAGPDWLRRLAGGSTSTTSGGQGIHYTSNLGPRSSAPASMSTRSTKGRGGGVGGTRGGGSAAAVVNAKDVHAVVNDAPPCVDTFRLRLVTRCELAALEPSATECSDCRADHNCDEDEEGGESWPAVAVLTDGTRLGVDLVVAAAGVDPAPCVDWLPPDTFPRVRPRR